MAALYVKLKDEEKAMVQHLRDAGENVSEMVRQAIREKYAQRRGKPPSGKDAVERLNAILDRYPPEPSERGRRRDVSDRKVLSAVIRERLAARRERSR